jgi:Protein of unknown function (DUF3823) N-terminal domain/Domain of unknown function (DUF3823_C)
MSKRKTLVMKIRFQYAWIILLSLAALSCKKDNYDEPKARLSGRIVYNGEALGFENYRVPYELYQAGYGKVGPIGSSFGQDGSFSATLFDGEYKLIVPNGQGPFLWPRTGGGNPDSLSISLRGGKTMDIEVQPYYMIRNAVLAAGGGKVTASFGLEKIITAPADAKDIEYVAIFINKTQFVSSAGDNKIGESGINGPAIVNPNSISLEVNIPSITPTQNYVFARIGLKIAGVEDWLYSPLQKLSF